MRFKAGYFGACIVVLALLGTVLAGFIGSVDATTEPVIKYDYVTDLSGLFDYTETRDYVNYNPNTNLTSWNGYHVTYDMGTDTYTYRSMVDYTLTPYANNYRVELKPSDTSTLSTFNQTTTQGANDYGPFAGTRGGIYANYNNSLLILEYGGSKLSTYLTTINADWRDYQTITLDNITNNNFPLFFYYGNWEIRTTTNWTGTYTSYTADFTVNNAIPTKIIIDTASNQATAYNGADAIYSASTEDIGVFAYTVTYGGGNADPNTVNTAITVKGTTGAEYGYMDPDKGVRVKNLMSNRQGNIGWHNGYENSEVTIKILKVGTDCRTNFFINNTSSNGILCSFVTSWVDDNLTIDEFVVNQSGTYATLLDLGSWPAVQATIKSDGSVTFTPTWDVSLTTVDETTSYSVTLNNRFTPADITRLTATSSDAFGGSARFQVTDTVVFLDTFNTVMNNPSIDINQYFPDIGDYRLNFYAFALYGASMTINGQVGTVDRDNATITFIINGDAVTNKLNNIYVSTVDGNTWLTFADTGRSYDLGATTTDVISFAGYWYFTTGLWEPYQALETNYSWDLDGGFHANAGQCLIVFFAIMAAAILIARVYSGISVKTLDWAIIGFASVFAYVYFGGMIV